MYELGSTSGYHGLVNLSGGTTGPMNLKQLISLSGNINACAASLISHLFSDFNLFIIISAAASVSRICTKCLLSGPKGPDIQETAGSDSRRND